MMGFFDYLVMTIYLLILIGIGYWFSRAKNQTMEKYLLGDRKILWWLSGISYFMAMLSTISLVSLPGEAFAHGVTMIVTSFLVPFATIGAFFLFIRFYFQAGKFTPYFYLESRYDPRIRTLVAILFCMVRITYLAIVLVATTKIFEGAANWPSWATIFLIGCVTILYTTLGGFKATVWCDFLQFLILVGGLTLILYKCISSVPENVFEIVGYAFEHERGFEYFGDPRFFKLSPFIRLNFWLLLLSAITGPLFETSADQMGIQRLLSTSSYHESKKTLLTHVFIAIPFTILFFFIGLAMFVFYSHNPTEGVTGDTALFRFVSTQMPTPLPGLIISAMLAAVLSTIAAGINSLSTVVTTDFYKRIFKPNSSDTEQVRFSRLSTIIIGVLIVGISLIIVTVNEHIGQTVMELSGMWLSMFLPIIAPIFLLGVTTRKLNGNNILTLAVISWFCTLIMVVWFVLSKHTDKPLSFMSIPIPSYAIMTLGGYIWALFSKPIDSKKIENLTLWTLKKS